MGRALAAVLLAAMRGQIPFPDGHNAGGWQRPISAHGGGAGKKRRAESFARRMGRRMRRGR